MYPIILILLPLFFAVAYQISSSEKHYKVVSIFMLIVLSTAAIYVVSKGTAMPQISEGLYEAVELSIKGLEIIIIGFLYYVTIKYKKWGVLSLTAVQTVITLYTLFFTPETTGGESLFSLI